MTQPCLKPMPDQILELNGLLQSILNDIENNMPARKNPSPTPKPTKKIFPLTPNPKPFNFKQGLIPLCNKEFTDPMLYHLHNQQNFLDLADDTNL